MAFCAESMYLGPCKRKLHLTTMLTPGSRRVGSGDGGSLVHLESCKFIPLFISSAYLVV